jgi:hypothetical protein
MKWSPKDYKRPEKLPAGCCYVSVVKVHDGSGVGDHEHAWACVMRLEHAPGGQPLYCVLAEEAAQRWYAVTDQSRDCSVTLKIDGENGETPVLMLVDLRWALQAGSRRVEAA